MDYCRLARPWIQILNWTNKTNRQYIATRMKQNEFILVVDVVSSEIFLTLRSLSDLMLETVSVKYFCFIALPLLQKYHLICHFRGGNPSLDFSSNKYKKKSPPRSEIMLNRERARRRGRERERDQSHTQCTSHVHALMLIFLI